MYGLVNKAIEGMVREGYGETTWQRVKAEAGVDIEGFISNQPYPDEITYRLVAGASAVLATPAEDILKAFGEYWVLNTGLKAYGPMMRAGGNDLKTFLLNLPHFHVRVQLLFPELEPPHFACENVGDDSLDLVYSTSRPAGLEPFVEGLVHGLARMFDTIADVRLVRRRGEEGVDASVFHVRWNQTG